MIDFIKVIDFKIQVCLNQQIIYYDEPFTKYMNRLLKPYLVNLKTRELLTKRMYKFNDKVPIYLDENHLFISVKSYRLSQAFYINYFQVLNWEKDKKSVILFFKDYHCMRLDSYHSFMNQIRKIDLMLDYSKDFMMKI